MANEKRLIDANALKRAIRMESWKQETQIQLALDYIDIIIDEQTKVDAVEVVRCKECRWAKPYERIDGETGYYCHFCGHSFKYGTNWERLFTPTKESDDFCSYGERREGNA